ncbi:hypothetical protein C482_09587 [Natrialba chahannaoensis JCM 10990]|uniref:Polysaccharide deacetylase n=1 Tax=Natrialba chahannaoensis JCM 10990 TaxID=1227492 RepID=M0AP54_9EURY|nr:hypothetical protein [Natrialba chahannaoensis]ELY99727.1 hypothetical protein C482_09587 [Natrialba chahannaoensis JCM 10990]
MTRGLSRRQLVAALGVTSTATVAGCLDVLSGDESPEADSNGGSDSNGDGDGGNGDENGTDSWPAIDHGELLSDFESADEWVAVTGETETVSDAPTGSQALAVESDSDQAAMRIEFPRGIDLDGWDTSMAVKADAVDQIHLEYMAPSRGDHLTSIRHVPDDYDGWLRLDFGYIQKHGDPDLSDVRRLNVVAVGPEDGTRLVADDLRKTEAADNGKAILSFYNGHASHYEHALDRLDERDWAGAVPVDPDQIGSGGRMDLVQLDELHERGWDICGYPSVSTPLPEMPEDRQRQVVANVRDTLADLGFEDDSRHFYAPADRMDDSLQTVLREEVDSAVLASGSPTGAPPTNTHMLSQIWGPDLHGGVRRAINLCDQYNQLVVLRIPRIVELENDEEASGNSMSLEDFDELVNHIEHRGLDVVTPSDVVDGTMDGDDEADDESGDQQGLILEAGENHSFGGIESNTTESFALEKGIVTADFSHDGDADLTVELVPAGDTNGDDRVIPTTSTATQSGESIITVEEGTYQLEVDADGAWSLDLDQPEVHSDDLTALPTDVSGSGSSYVGPFDTEGNVSLDVTHDGDGLFMVDGYGADGRSEQLIHQNGTFDSSRSYSAGGAVWLNVEADGDWTIALSDS